MFIGLKDITAVLNNNNQQQNNQQQNNQNQNNQNQNNQVPMVIPFDRSGM